jgi:hypothetical protein
MDKNGGRQAFLKTIGGKSKHRDESDEDGKQNCIIM